jgi:uncharacterized protein involved in cysteine biosynthesis
MLRLPLHAAQLQFTRPKLFALGLFPGLFTLVASIGVVYALWDNLLQGRSLWIVVPFLFVSLLLLWLVIGKLALLPVEDAIVDECQRALWGEVRLPSPRLTLKRLVREGLVSTLVTVGSLGILVLSFVPVLTPFEFVFTCWIAAYSFLSTIYVRRVESARGRLTLFFGHPMGHFLLGAFLYFLLFVPVLNVFLLGYAQVLASLVYFHEEEEARLTHRR